MSVFRICKHIKNYIDDKISNINIFNKLIIAFIIIIIFPLIISYTISEKTANDLIVKQVSSETMSSIQLVSDSVDSLLKRMSSIALYINEDKGIKELIQEEAAGLYADSNASPEVENLKKLNRINMFNSIITNINFNMIGTKSYITIITSTGKKYTNWDYNGQSSDGYFDMYMPGKSENVGTDLIWRGIEKNYIESARNVSPYVITLVKHIFDSTGQKKYGTFVISIPENEISKLMTAKDEQQKRVVIDDHMKVISSTVKDWLNQPFDRILELEFPADQKGYFMAKDEEGKKSIISYHRIRDWKIVDIKSYSSITNQLDQTRNNLLMINVIFVLFFLVMSAIIAQNISKPLRRLTKIMLNTDLEYSYNESAGTRNDEIGILEKSFNIMRNNIKMLLQENMDKERKKRDSELKLLQAQIGPHFLFNTLNTIRWAAINNNTEKVDGMVLALSKLLRMTIVKGDEFITLEEEIENLKNYAAIFQMRYSIAIGFVCDLDEDMKQYKIPKLLLQPLVENAIIHGFEGVLSGGIIELTGRKQDGFVILYVKDNGVGMDMDSLFDERDVKSLKFSGIGVNNVDERIKLYYGENYGLKIKSEIGKGTTVEVWLPERHESQGVVVV